MNRRNFIVNNSALALSAVLSNSLAANLHANEMQPPKELFEISLSQWSYHRAIFGDSRKDYNKFIKALHTDPDTVLQGELDPQDIVKKSRQLEVDVVDLVNILWFGHGQDKPWLKQFKQKAGDQGVRFGVLMCDELGNLGASDLKKRKQAVENHIRWMETAAALDCQHFRVNAYGDGSYLEQCQQCAESLHALGEASEQYDFDVLVENHGHPGSNGAWLAMLVEMSKHPDIGVFADFDNFFMGGWGLEPERRYDRHQGMLDLAPFTRAVSAKSHDFDEDGAETKIDFAQCLKVAMDGGFKGLASAEYEGDRLTEDEGTKLTVDHLRNVRSSIQ
jgi:sugar phosphate isomerase/epimerase